MAAIERSDIQPDHIPKILVVDDEHTLVDLVCNYLEAEGFSVQAAYDGVSALEMARSDEPDLIVLDILLPGLDGVEVCRRLRRFSDSFVLMLTAKSEEMDKVVGLSVGADDYVTKPFSPRELVARVKALLRRRHMSNGFLSEVSAPPPMLFGELVVDMARHEVSQNSRVVHLTLREFDLLSTLAAHPGRVFTRNQLLERIWGDKYYDDHVVDVHMTNLRKKLEDDPSTPRFIETVRGVGYRFLPHVTPGHEGTVPSRTVSR